MAFKKAINITPIWNNKDLAEGGVIEGVYLTKETMTGKYGVQSKYVIALSDDEKISIVGTASIDAQFANVPVGSMVRVTYKGKTTTKTGNTVKVFDVEYDDENIAL